MPERITTYVEPFLGGGSMFIHVMQNYQPEQIVLGDANDQVMNIYHTVKFHMEQMIEILSKIEQEYVPLEYNGRKEYYRAIRKRQAFDETMSDIERASIQYFLMRTCFNGQYVVTSNGRFFTSPGELNVKNPIQYDHIRAWNFILKDAILCVGDWKATVATADIGPDSFVFLDPPYRESNLLGNQYMSDFFHPEQQDKMTDEIIEYVKNFRSDATVFLCNMEKHETGYFDNLGHGLETIKIPRKVTSFRDRDHHINEILIHNGEKEITLENFFD